MASLSNTSSSNLTALGQHGSAYVTTDANEVVPPKGLVIVAIQMIDNNTALDKLIADNDSKYASVAHAANSKAKDSVGGSGGVTNGTFVDMDGDATAVVGDSVLNANGDFLAVVKSVGLNSSGGSDSSFIELDRNVTIDNSAVLHFVTGEEGGGGQQIATDKAFPAGITIYGRWKLASLGAGAAIMYFGP